MVRRLMLTDRPPQPPFTPRRATVPASWRELPFQVYLAHAHDDFLLVERVWRMLDHVGIRAYMYEHFPHPGRTPCDAVLSAMSDSAEVVPFLTTAGSASAWLHQELGAAFALAKPLLPVIQTTAAQAPGYASFQQPLLLEPRHPEVALGRLLWLLRVDFEVFDGRVTVECPSCRRYAEAELPGLQAVRRAMDANALLEGVVCPACGAPSRLSPWTLEPVSEQMALGRTWSE